MRVGNLLKQIIIYLVRRKWFLFGFLPGILILGIFVVLLAGHFLMTYPGICLHCHVPQTRVMMWTKSVHPSEVTCVNCHAKPGQLFPHRYSAKDEFVNNNCVYCHKGVETKEKQVSHDIKIAHRLHIQELELRCVDCHRNIVHEKTIPGTNRPSHETCIECHEEVTNDDACQLCHI
jgi:nitrate/TMAO reductase-like tetraheme cytochrome c subunit